MERNVLVDRLRGYACFLVLFGHVIMGMRNAGVPMPAFFAGLEVFIWSFHVALFLFLSGNVYRLTDGWKSKGTKTGFVLHKAISLGVPYVVFSAVYIAINSLVGSTNTPFSLEDILYLYKTPVAQYWYLYALFFLLLIWTVLSGILKNWQITAGAVLIAYLLPTLGLSLGSFAVVFDSALAFGLGSIVSISALEKLPRGGKIAVCIAHVLLGAVPVIFGKAEAAGFKELLLVLGIFASIQLISLLQGYSPIARFLDFCNKYSFQTYLLHTIFTAGIRIVLLRCGVTLWPVHLLLGCVLGLGLSVLAAVIAKKTKVLDIFFFPTKVFGMFQKK